MDIPKEVIETGLMEKARFGAFELNNLGLVLGGIQCLEGPLSIRLRNKRKVS